MCIRDRTKGDFFSTKNSSMLFFFCELKPSLIVPHEFKAKIEIIIVVSLNIFFINFIFLIIDYFENNQK